MGPVSFTVRNVQNAHNSNGVQRNSVPGLCQLCRLKRWCSRHSDVRNMAGDSKTIYRCSDCGGCFQNLDIYLFVYESYDERNGALSKRKSHLLFKPVLPTLIAARRLLTNIAITISASTAFARLPRDQRQLTLRLQHRTAENPRIEE